MATLQDAINHMKHNGTPFWWLKSGPNKVGQFVKSDNMEDSIEHLQQQISMLPAGNYDLKSADKESNHAGAVHFRFSTTVAATGATTPTMQAAPITNAYGIPDHILKQVQDETRFKLLVEGMADNFNEFMKEWPEYKKKIDKIDAFLKEDADGDGIPDILESAQKIGKIAETATNVKKVFEGASVFRS